MRWYLSRTGAAEGPFDEHVLIEMIRAGQVPDHSHVAAEGGSAWQPIASHAPFASARAPAAPAAPASGVAATMAMDSSQLMASMESVAGAATPASAPSAPFAGAASSGPATPAAQPAGAPSQVASFAQSPVAQGPSHASGGPAHAQPSFGGAPASTAASAPGAMGSDPLQPGMLPLKKSSPMLPLAATIVFLLAGAFSGYSFTHYRGVASRYEDTAEFHRRRAQSPAEPGDYYSPEDHARRATEDEDDSHRFARKSWMYCAGSGFALVLALGMIGLFLVLRRKVKLQHAEVDRIAAARREAGLDPFTGKPRAAAPAITSTPGAGGPAWQPQNEVDGFVLEAVRDTLEPGEIVRGAGVLFRDAPVIYIVLQILGTIAGILPSIPFIFLRAGQQKIWFALPTDRRLLLVRTKRGGFSGAPKRMNLGVAGLPYADVAAVQRKGTKMTLRTRDGRSPAVVLTADSGGLRDAQRFRSEVPAWLERHVAERGAAAAA